MLAPFSHLYSCSAQVMLQDQREALDKIAEALLKYETISGDECGAVLRGDDIGEFRAAQERQLQSAEKEEKLKAREQEQAEKSESAASDENPEAGLSGA